MRRLTTALKWFAYGLGLGVLFAPRSGAETRAQLIQAVSNYLSQALRSGSQAATQAAQQVQQAGTQAQQASTQMDPNVQVREAGVTRTTFSGGPA